MPDNSVLCVIPARYGSTRLPRKPLIQIGGRPLVMWVYDCARAAGAFDTIVVATDHEEIRNTVRRHGGEAVMTSPDHARGTDRVLEAAGHYPHRFVVNLQGDEPRIPPEVLRDFASALRSQIDDNSLLTCATNATIEEKNEPNVVKVVLNGRGEALYFSRAPIPYDCHGDQTTFLKHGGIYGFTREGLCRFCSFGQATLEKLEKLEQLRALENGMRIRCIVRDYDSVGVDTAEDLERLRSMIEV